MDNCESNAGELDKITRQDESSTMGQSESKKNGGKHVVALHPTQSARGTATATSKGSMSFGFKKGSSSGGNKSTATSAAQQKQHDKATNKKEYAKIPPDNSDSLASLQVDEMTGGSKLTSRLVAPRKEQSGQSYRSNRFGFRQANIVRPTSTGLQPKVSDFEQEEDDPNNNHPVAPKPRSKSALGRTPTTSDRLNNNSTAAVRQNTIADIKSARTMNAPPLMTKPPIKTPSVDSISMGSQQGAKKPHQTTRISIKLHSHSIDTADKDCSKDTVRKFTLHTTNLPQPEYAVPVSVRTTRMELKNVKQSLNNSRREFLGLNTQNEPIKHQSQTYNNSLRQQRNLEMVMSGRHKFEVRDLEDSLREETVVVPLSLPKLPSAFDSAASTQTVPNGLIRQDNQQQQQQHQQVRSGAEKESIEEEKLLFDSTNTEKSTSKNNNCNRRATEEEEAAAAAAAEMAQSTASTMADSITMKSINTSWSIAGESMMHESQLSSTKKTNTCSQVMDLQSEEATLNAPPSLAADYTDTEVTLNDVQLDLKDDDEEEQTLNGPFESELEKYANDHNDPMLEDETSPSVSLLTSSSGKEALGLVTPLQEVLEEDDQLEDTPEPDNIKSPTHTSNSNSLSEQGRDFLIDDEIADQPGLFSNYQNDSESVELPKALSNDKALVRASPLSKHRQLQIKSKLSPLFVHTSPMMKLRQVQRCESLDTLSPCDSIASDDLMMDFESQSSFESIDRLGSATLREDLVTGAPTAAANEMQLWQELEQQSGDLFREWKHILSSATATNIRNTPPTPSPPPAGGQPSSASTIAVVPSSNLPSRGTRLLNRSRIQGVLTNSPDSPRCGGGVEQQIPRPRRSSSLTKTPSPFQAHANTPPTTINRGINSVATTTDDLSITRSTRNTMIQDVLYFKKQLLRLRRLLQEDEDILKRTDTLNPFEMMNGDISSPHDNKTSRHLAMYQSMDKHMGTDVGGNSSSNGNGEENNNSHESGNWNDNQPQQLEDDDPNNNLSSTQELLDVRRQLVYLQSQLDENSRTIRIQKNLITKYETEKQQAQPSPTRGIVTQAAESKRAAAPTTTVATQTERLRPVSQSRINGISSRTEHNGHNSTTKIRSRSIGIPTATANSRSSNGKQPISLISGLGIDAAAAEDHHSNKLKSPRTNYTENLLLQNNRNRMHLLSTTPPSQQQQQQRGQINYSHKKSSMDDLLSIKHLSVSPPKYYPSTMTTTAASASTRRVPISRISLKYLRPSLASSTNSLSSVNHSSIASSTSSLSDTNNTSKSCLKIDSNYS